MADSIVPIGELVKAFQAAGITVERDTWTGYFNATRAIAAWNASSGQKKRLNNFLVSPNTKEFIVELEAQENSLESSQYPERWTGKALEAFEGQSSNLRQQGTWMHPLLFIKFAGWLNVKLEIMVYRIIMGVMNGTLIIQAPIYGGRDRKEVIVPHGQIPQITPYNSEDYLRDRKAEFGW